MPRPFFDFVMHHVGADALISPNPGAAGKVSLV